jgi:hypothetical protein
MKAFLGSEVTKVRSTLSISLSSSTPPPPSHLVLFIPQVLFVPFALQDQDDYAAKAIARFNEMGLGKKKKEAHPLFLSFFLAHTRYPSLSHTFAHRHFSPHRLPLRVRIAPQGRGHGGRSGE